MKITQYTGTDGTVRLALAGELDLATVDLLREHVEQTVTRDRPGRLVVDLAELTFCDSTGLGALVDARTRAVDRGVPFQVTNACGMVQTAMRIVGVHEVLTGP